MGKASKIINAATGKVLNNRVFRVAYYSRGIDRGNVITVQHSAGAHMDRAELRNAIDSGFVCFVLDMNSRTELSYTAHRVTVQS